MTDRPRDRLGRPVAADDPDAVAPVPAIDGLVDDEVWALALGFLDAGLPFHAHEVFEARWRTAPPDEREAWRALAQWGAALTHAARGNSVGAARLAERASMTLDGAVRVPACVDVDRMCASCRALAGSDAVSD